MCALSKGPSIIFKIFMSVQSILFVYPFLPTQKFTMKILLLNLFHVCLYAY